MKSVLTMKPIFKKSWSLWRQAWLASSLLEKILGNTSDEGPSTQPVTFDQTPTTTQPEEIRGKYGQEPQHNPAFLQKLLWEGRPKGNCTTVAEWSMFLFCQKITTGSIMPAKLFDFLFQPVPVLLVIWLIMPQDSLCQMSLLVNKIMCFPVFRTCLHFSCYFMQITH